MAHFVYILMSEKDGSYYIGHTRLTSYEAMADGLTKGTAMIRRG